MTVTSGGTMSYFNEIRHGDADSLDALLDSRTMNEQELRAALQNVLGMAVSLQRRVKILEQELGIEL